MRAEDLSGKVALVTGGASGIGLGMATVLARAGMKLVLVDIDEAALAAAARELEAGGATVLTARLDVRDRSGWSDLVARVDAELGGVFILCNNAGVSAFDKLAEMSAANWDWIVGINLDGVFNGVHAVVPGMIARGAGGHVVNTASAGGLGSIPGVPIGSYYVTKAGVIALSEKLREEVAEHGIGVSVLCPGLVETRLQQTSQATRPEGTDLRGETPLPDDVPGVISAVEAGEHVLRGVLANRTYIYTHADVKPLVQGRFAALLADFEPAQTAQTASNGEPA